VFSLWIGKKLKGGKAAGYKWSSPDLKHHRRFFTSKYHETPKTISFPAQVVIDAVIGPWGNGRVSHLLTSAKMVMLWPEGETTDGRSSGKVSALSK
jgi:hypothetical protein